LNSVPQSTATSDDDPPLWLAIWNPRRSVAYAVDVHAHEPQTVRRSLRSAGENFAGPFTSQGQAQDFAVDKLAAALKRRPRR
jgi:hypothetical protein